jgi:hypothetical protein
MSTIGIGPGFSLPKSWFWVVAWIVGIIGWVLMDWDSITWLFTAR